MKNLSSLVTDKAPILHRGETEICFRVDDVEPCRQRLPLTEARRKLEERIGRPLCTFSHDDSYRVVSGEGVSEHAFVNTVYWAFSEHRPLVLTPDTVWLTLAQGFAQHINNHAEALRSRFVSHKDKVTLRSSAIVLTTAEHWADVIQQWANSIQHHVGADLYQLMICDFSTTTPIVRTASQVVMLDAFQQYFDYEMRLICGIPSITFKGSVDDWVRIRERVDVMAGYHLEWWTDRLKPICDAFIQTAEGSLCQTFWRHIFSPKEVYGGELITGWLADLFPYITDEITNAPTVRNPILAIPREKLTSEGGLSPRSVPTGLSQAPFTVKFTPTQETKMELVAGFVGVKQDSESGRLEAEIGWTVVEEDEFSRVLAKLVPEYEKGAPMLALDGLPKELIRLMGRFGNGYTFYPDSKHSWCLKSVAEVAEPEIPGGKFPTNTAVHFMDLIDGRGIAYVPVWSQQERSTQWWIIVGRLEGDAFLSRDVKVIAKGITQFLERLVSAEGQYYFDDPGFVPDGSV
jgi:hypothetical protein